MQKAFLFPNNSSVHFLPLFQFRVTGVLEPVPPTKDKRIFFFILNLVAFFKINYFNGMQNGNVGNSCPKFIKNSKK